MFTGVIEETGKIVSIENLSSGISIGVSCKKVLEDSKIGDSISVNGVCTTVVRLDSGLFKADISSETLNKTTFSHLKIGQSVNLERALTPNSRIGGHFVLGHVDCTGSVVSLKKLEDFCEIKIRMPHEFLKYVVYKGSIAVDGISLTISDTDGDVFKVAVIPHSFENTNLKTIKTGDSVNIETDILGRYVEKMLMLGDNSVENRINSEFLKENGFM